MLDSEIRKLGAINIVVAGIHEVDHELYSQRVIALEIYDPSSSLL